MDFWIGLGGLGLALVGVVVVALADASLSRRILIYMDAVEANLQKVAEALHDAGVAFKITPMDLKRDRGQDRVRALKLLGWCALAAGLAAQAVALWLGRQPA